MNLSNIYLNNSFKSKQIIKVIAGINNTKISEVVQVASAAELSGASYLDITANIRLVKFLKSFLSLPLCISSIDPIDIYNCVLSGADLVEVGNYDVFYKNNIYITSKQLLNLVKEIKSLIGNYDICVTIPSHMNLYEQINLAQHLEYLGINILQTEGFTINHSLYSKSYFNNYLATSLLSTYVLSKNVSIPIITSSGMNSLFSNVPIYYGASGLGIGSAVKNRSSLTSMVNYISAIKSSMLNNLCSDKNKFYSMYNYDNFINMSK